MGDSMPLQKRKSVNWKTLGDGSVQQHNKWSKIYIEMHKNVLS